MVVKIKICVFFQIDLQKLKVQDDKSFNTKHFKPQIYIFIPSANAIYEQEQLALYAQKGDTSK